MRKKRLPAPAAFFMPAGRQVLLLLLLYAIHSYRQFHPFPQSWVIQPCTSVRAGSCGFLRLAAIAYRFIAVSPVLCPLPVYPLIALASVRKPLQPILRCPYPLSYSGFWTRVHKFLIIFSLLSYSFYRIYVFLL
jgi:hypothetical protein